MNIVILASGRGSNAKAIIEAEKTGRLKGGKVVCVISDHEDAPVLKMAEESGIPAKFIDAGGSGARFGDGGTSRYVEEIKSLGGELVVLAGFMRILPEKFIDEFPNSMINLHPSLLPAFKGRDAIRRAYEYGVKICGCTVHRVSAEVDGGKILAQKAVKIGDGETLVDLENRIHEAEHELLVDTVGKIVSGEIK